MFAAELRADDAVHAAQWEDEDERDSLSQHSGELGDMVGSLSAHRHPAFCGELLPDSMAKPSLRQCTPARVPATQRLVRALGLHIEPASLFAPQKALWGLCVRRGPASVWCGGWRCKHLADGVAVALLAVAAVLALLGPLVSQQIAGAAQTALLDSLAFDSPAAPSYARFVSNTLGARSDVARGLDVYVFNVTNAAQVLERGAAPALSQLGPYRYGVAVDRFDIVFATAADGAETVRYAERRTYTWDAAFNGRAGTSEDDQVVVPNLAALRVAEKLRGTAMRKTVKALLEVSFPPCGTVEDDDGPTGELCDAAAAADAYLGAHDEAWHYILKLTLCAAPEAAFGAPALADLEAPFAVRTFREVWWGYAADPLLELVGSLLADAEALLLQNRANAPNATAAWRTKGGDDPTAVTAAVDTWTSSVPGLLFNHTSRADALQRSGYSHVASSWRQAHAYKSHKNMTANQRTFTCIAYDPSLWNETAGEEPQCAPFEASWSVAAAQKSGWAPPWGDSADAAGADTIGGTDGTQFAARSARRGAANGGADAPSVEAYLDAAYRRVRFAPAAGGGGDGDDGTDGAPDWRGQAVVRLGVSPEEYYVSAPAAGAQSAAGTAKAAALHQDGPEGLWNLTAPLGGSPVFLSKPHFLGAAPALAAAVTGLSPSEADHDTFIDVEPYSGRAARAAWRLQYSARVVDWDFPVVSAAESRGYETAAQAAYVSVCRALRKGTISVPEYDFARALQWCADHRTLSKDRLDRTAACLARPSNWTLASPALFVPLGWTEETYQGSDDDAAAYAAAADQRNVAQGVGSAFGLASVLAAAAAGVLVVYRLGSATRASRGRYSLEQRSVISRHSSATGALSESLLRPEEVEAPRPRLGTW